jgi:hypothetical protein
MLSSETTCSGAGIGRVAFAVSTAAYLDISNYNTDGLKPSTLLPRTENVVVDRFETDPVSFGSASLK